MSEGGLSTVVVTLAAALLIIARSRAVAATFAMTLLLSGCSLGALIPGDPKLTPAQFSPQMPFMQPGSTTDIHGFIKTNGKPFKGHQNYPYRQRLNKFYSLRASNTEVICDGEKRSATLVRGSRSAPRLLANA
ncbi:MAG TPA: hypothetical protein V6D17_08815 [Candidatus Obscuribacterales bacterium]